MVRMSTLVSGEDWRISMPGSVSSKARMPRRTMAWSSATRIRYGLGPAFSLGASLVIMLNLLGRDRKQSSNGGTSARGADDIKLSMQQTDAFAHAGDPHAQWHLRGSVGKNVEDANAIVLDFHQDGGGVAFDPHACGRGSGVAVKRWSTIPARCERR